MFCFVCGKLCLPGKVTCSDECHEKLVQELEEKFGVYKRVKDSVTGKIYRVPTRDIVEKGLSFGDLMNYPEWG
jgi:hypothetical protein